MRLTPTMEVLLAAVAELAGTEATPANAEELVEEFGNAARMIGAVIRNTANPTMLEAGYKTNVVPGDGDCPRRRPLPARPRGRVLVDARDPRRARMSRSMREVHLTGIETTYDGAWPRR